MCSVLVEVALRNVMDRYVITPMNAENKTQSSDCSLALRLKIVGENTGRNMREKMQDLVSLIYTFFD